MKPRPEHFSSPLEAQLHTFAYDTLTCGPLRSDAYCAGERPATVRIGLDCDSSC